MATYTICYSGTDCFLDQALVLRKPEEMNSYNVSSGYIPSKVYHDLTLANGENANCTTMNGCGIPYLGCHESLPVRVWSLESEEVGLSDPDPEYFSVCSNAPSYGQSDRATGKSVEIISIAGIASMLGVTLHLIPIGQLDDIKQHWNEQYSDGYGLDKLAYPKNNSMWNNTPQASAGHYCLRWSEADNNKIEAFIKDFKTVALVGHSRGGVACLIASNYIAEWFAPLGIKIIALDPVPGPGDWWECITQIPGIKNMEYVGIYAIDETSYGFNGVVPRVKYVDGSKKVSVWDPLSPIKSSSSAGAASWSNNDYQLIYTRGRHATVPGSRSSWGQGDTDPNNDNVGASGNLANAYAIKKLNGWGLALTEISDQQVSTWIADMNRIPTHFKEMRNYTYTPAAKVGLIGLRWYYQARGISSTSGNNPNSWNYLEAFIQYVTSDNIDDVPNIYGGTTDPALINDMRGLINQGVRDTYYDEYGGTDNVHPWHFLSDLLSGSQSA